jgi:hypothetical protein
MNDINLRGGELVRVKLRQSNLLCSFINMTIESYFASIRREAHKYTILCLYFEIFISKAQITTYSSPFYPC